MSATEMVQLVRRGEISRSELVQAHLHRIDEHNDTINAIVEQRAKQAIAEAEVADRDAGNRKDLPLDGVPVSIKDHFDVAGMKHTEGVRSLAEQVSPADEIAVARLREAGAIVIGKSNQPDFQIRWNTISDLYGATRNPRNPELSVGGSSGGDAAAVAAGMAAIGLGADYGGSIRVPATFCGIYGLRPSAGRVPAVGTLPPFDGPPTMDFMASIGPFARSVEDLWTCFSVLSGPHPRDPSSIDMALGERDPAARPRIARVSHQTGATIEPEVEANLDATADILASAGYEIVDAAFPGAKRAPELWGELVGTELLHTAMPIWRDMLGESGLRLIEDLFGLYDLGTDVSRYIESFIERRQIAGETALWMEDHPLVLAPVAGMPTPGLDFDHLLDRDQLIDLFDHMRNVVWVNLLGLPGIALPNGIQIVARRFHESQAFDAAAIVAQELSPVSIADPSMADE